MMLSLTPPPPPPPPPPCWVRLLPKTMQTQGHVSSMFFFKGASLAFYILSALFFDNFVIIFVVTVLLAALDFWVVKNVSGRILVGLRWRNEINDLGEGIWKFESLDPESLARMNKKDSWLFWWSLYLTAALWIILEVFSLIRFQADYLLVVAVCLSLSIVNIISFTKCCKDCISSSGAPSIAFTKALNDAYLSSVFLTHTIENSKSGNFEELHLSLDSHEVPTGFPKGILLIETFVDVSDMT
ncbi:Golgi apparatus membrane protein-like protein ECHIDNA [Spinacia oleracea]|uniref:Golgi apparatus membrane protein TVP23 n=1 Tax=Spinacia oleracea TaxID=3562 RepID=A0ABM3QQH4_SPIOL|nr:Golgi apparatus membrane protein-like protein ECHIDNA [Spinacia oleracea]